MGKRILIADDSVTIQKAFAMSLTGEDFTLTAARSADEGLSLARQFRPDLVVADATMPGRSGYELCAALKADATLKTTPVYILSSAQQPYDEAKGRQVGSDGNLLKPWDSIQLVEKLKEALSRPAGAPAPGLASSAPAVARPTSPIPIAALEAEYDVDLDSPRDTRETPAARIPEKTTEMPIARTTGPMPAQPAAYAPAPVRAPAPAAAPPAAQSSPGGMRPSLIPGVRPGAMPPMRPGATSPARTLGGAAPMMPGAGVPPRPAAQAPVGRTLFGLPAASMPFPGASRGTAPSMPTVPAASPGMSPAPSPVSLRPAPTPMSTPALSHSNVSSLVDQKVAAIAAKGPEYEALAKLSREVIEQIVWEIVPELAEAIIREHVAKRERA